MPLFNAFARFFMAALSAAALVQTPVPPTVDAHAADAAVQPARGFLYRTLKIGDETYAYSVYVPPEYTAENVWPVVLFLHGSGERGTDGLLQTEVGIGTTLRRNHTLIPAIVVMPQCRPLKTWTGDMALMATRCVDDVARDYKLDPQRVYLTGLSLGGAGAFFLGGRLTDTFAAIITVCGFGDTADAAGLAKTPIWIWHGSADRNVPVKQSREMADAIKKAGGEVKFTEIPGGDHFIWDKVYSDPELWKWVFAQRRIKTATQPASK
jgi:predicted peptidase